MPSCFPGHTRIPFPKIIVKNNAHTHCPYSPEQLAIIGQAGLLTRSFRTPSRPTDLFRILRPSLLPEEKVTIRMQNPF